MILRSLLVFGLMALALGCGFTLGAQPFYRSELIFPLERVHDHASCVVELPNGDLLACWYRGVGPEKGDDVQIFGARRLKGAQGWSSRFLLADTPGYPDDNPCLFIDQKRRLWLLWPTLLANRWQTAVMQYRVASDYQMRQGPPVWSWQELLHVTPVGFQDQLSQAIADNAEAQRELVQHYGKEVVEQGLARLRAESGDKLAQRLGWMTRAHPTLLPSGRLIVPLYTDTFSVSVVAITDDLGQSWKTSGLIAPGAIQPSVVRRRDGTLVAMMRAAIDQKRIMVSESRDEGMTWSPVHASPLPNPGSGLEVLRLADGRWALVYNDTEQGRQDLAVSLSDDEGATWRWTRHLEKDTSGAYPSIIQAGDGMLHVTYSHHLAQGQTIKYATFNEAWVMQGDPK